MDNNRPKSTRIDQNRNNLKGFERIGQIEKNQPKLTKITEINRNRQQYSKMYINR